MTLERLLAVGRDVLSSEPVEIPAPSERSRLRKAAGVSATTAAVLCGVTRQSIEQWESGQWNPARHLEPYGRLLAWCERVSRAAL